MQQQACKQNGGKVSNVTQFGGWPRQGEREDIHVCYKWGAMTRMKRE
jgi:hypothetical protein